MLGPVFRAHEPAGDRLVAIKVFRLDLSRTQARELADELERLVQIDLTHPSIATLIAAGIEAGDPYLVLEYLAAESLDVALRRYGPPPLADTLRLVAQLAGAIDYAAVIGANHGALHPRDVLVVAGETRVTGFGIARALERVGLRVPIRRPYSALERIARRDWNQSADVFALAAIVHELIQGRSVGSREQPDRTAWSEDAGRSTLDAVFASALAPEPEARYPTALAFAAALGESAGEIGSQRPSFQTPGAAQRLRPRDAGDAELQPGPALDQFAQEEDLKLEVRAAPVDAEDWSSVPLNREPPSEGAERFSIPEPSEPAGSPDWRKERASLTTPETKRASAREWRYDATQPEPLDRPLRLDGRAPDARVLVEPTSDERSRRLWPLALALLVAAFLGGFGWYEFHSAKSEAEPSAPPGVAPTSGRTEVEKGGTPPKEPKEWTEGSMPESSGAKRPSEEPAPRQAPRVGGSSVRSEPQAPGVQRSAPAQPAPGAVPQGREHGRVLVRSTPAGAEVVLDGRMRGETPLAVRDLAFGTHIIRVTRRGYDPQERQIIVRAGEPALSVDFVLSPSGGAGTPAPQPATGLGSMFVESQPPRAMVYLDGRLVARTPLLISQLNAGPHTLRLEFEGYQPWSSSVQVVTGERSRVSVSLVPRPER